LHDVWPTDYESSLPSINKINKKKSGNFPAKMAWSSL